MWGCVMSECVYLPEEHHRVSTPKHHLTIITPPTANAHTQSVWVSRVAIHSLELMVHTFTSPSLPLEGVTYILITKFNKALQRIIEQIF